MFLCVSGGNYIFLLSGMFKPHDWSSSSSLALSNHRERDLFRTHGSKQTVRGPHPIVLAAWSHSLSTFSASVATAVVLCSVVTQTGLSSIPDRVCAHFLKWLN